MTTSQVYYRKWRPRRLSDVVGQSHVTQTLKHALAQGRVAHAYLFCGPRGTGKTSTARILAKAVNCARLQDGEPCDACPMCRAINEGRALDLIELDAASHRGIDEIRNIRDKVHFVPTEARYKVYIIDEAHQLTEHAVNALLKTLEEPPPHVIFVLATTEPQDLLPTLVSRCQRFDFRRITNSDIVERLRVVCQAEGIEAEAEALSAVARAASGSLRDAENLLEQLVVSHGASVTQDSVRRLLGVTDEPLALALVGYVLRGEVPQALALINNAAAEGMDMQALHRQVVEHLRGALLLKTGATATLDFPGEVVEKLKALASGVSLEKVTAALRVLGRLNMRYEGPHTLPLELAVVECAMGEVEAPTQSAEGIAKAATGISGGGPAPVRAEPPQPPRSGNSVMQAPKVASPQTSTRMPTKVFQPQASQPAQRTPPKAPAPVPKAPERQAEAGSSAEAPRRQADPPRDQRLDAIIKALIHYKGKHFIIGSLFRDCKGFEVQGDSLLLKFKYASHMDRMQKELEDPVVRKTVQDALAKVLGTAYILKPVLLEDNPAKGETPEPHGHLVRAAIEMGGVLVQDKKERDE